MWRDYFGSSSKVFGIDINPACKAHEGDQIKIYIGDQSDRNFLKYLYSEIEEPSIIIDDGGHTMTQQITTFEELYLGLHADGTYLIEDLHTSYWEEYGGGYLNQNSFIEYAKSHIDKLNAWHIRNNQLSVSNFTKHTKSVVFYDSIVVFERGKKFPPKPKKTGNPNN